MTDSNLPTKVGIEAPAWLVEEAAKDTSLDHVKNYRRLTRLRIVQGNTPEAKARIKRYGEGAVIAVPSETVIAEPKELFGFVPLFMFTEFCKWRDRNDKSSNERILERSMDETSVIAQRARDRKARIEPYTVEGRNFDYQYIEHLCFPGVIYGGPHHATPVTISFEKGEFRRGTDFCSAIMLRKIGATTAPLWSQVWQLRSGDGEDGHANPDYTWWGFNYETGPQLLIKDEEVDMFRALHQELSDKYEARELQVDRSDAGEEVVDVDDPNLDM